MATVELKGDFPLENQEQERDIGRWLIAPSASFGIRKGGQAEKRDISPATACLLFPPEDVDGGDGTAEPLQGKLT
jgi:hypothetical protein